MADVIEQIRRLRDEAAREQFDYPSTWSLVANHPGVLAYQLKTEPHYQQDMRRASWLDKVAAMQRQYQDDGRGLQFRDAVNPKFLEAVERRGELKGPYWNRGVMAFGQPLREGLNWAGAIPATIYNAGRMAAGVEGADRDFEDSADLASGRMLGLAVGRENPTQQAWEMERKAAEERPLEDLSFVMEGKTGARILPTMDNLQYESLASRGQTSGNNVLGELGVQEGWKRQLAGALMDAAVDPVSGARSGIRALLGGKYLHAAADIGSEMALPGAFIAAGEGLKRQAEQYRRDQERSMAGY